MHSSEHEFTVVIEEDEDGHSVADVPELLSCGTQARSLADLFARLDKLVGLCRDAAHEEQG